MARLHDTTMCHRNCQKAIALRLAQEIQRLVESSLNLDEVWGNRALFLRLSLSISPAAGKF
jgi:hypothetical protein